MLRDSGAVLEATLRFPVEAEPAAGELLDLDRDIEIIGQQLTQRGRRPWPLRQKPRVIYQRIVGDRLPVLQTLGAEPHQIQQMMREAIALAPLIGHCEAVFLPGLEEQRNHPVVEDVQEVGQGMVFRP